jgi:hypothetical protein
MLTQFFVCVCVFRPKCGEGESAWDPTLSDLLWGNRDQSFQCADFNFASKVFSWTRSHSLARKVALCYPISVDLLVTPVGIKLSDDAGKGGLVSTLRG